LGSNIDKGSVFSFTLNFEHATFATNEMDNMVSYSNAGEDKLVGRKLLVVEDNQINLFVVKQFLQKWGVITTFAENGKQALDMALESDFDLILMDLHMPIMDGYLATSKILAVKPNQVILAMTANQDAEVEQRVKEAGMLGIVLKPFQPEEFAAQLKEIFS
jgi:two-component system, sensor histidine kinase